MKEPAHLFSLSLCLWSVQGGCLYNSVLSILGYEAGFYLYPITYISS